jgi:glycosyltransferase involved in cell wall biosynthesis
MNILWLSTRSPYPLISGHSMRTYHTMRNASQKHNIFLVTFIQLEEELQEENLEHLRSFCRRVFPFRIPVDESRCRLGVSAFRNLFSPLPFVAQKYNVRSMREKIREVVASENIDLVHVDLLHLSVYLAEFAEIPKIVANHNVESVRIYRWFEAEQNLLKRVYLHQQWLKLRSFEQSCMERFDSCIVVSEKDKESLEAMGIRSRMFVVPNGTDTKYFRPSEKKPEVDRVLWLGHMDVHTNRDAVLYFWREIFPVLRKRHPAVRMEFVGTSPPEEIVDAAKNDDRVETSGFVDDIRPHMEMASAVVVPIRIGSGTRVKILDAMALGKAIVSTSVGCEGIQVTDGEDIFIADDPEGFAEKIVTLLKNDRIRITLEKNARRLALTYDWSLGSVEQERAYEYAVMKKDSARTREAGSKALDPGVLVDREGRDSAVRRGSVSDDRKR